MTINYELSEEDYIKFNVHHIEDSPSQMKLFWVLRVLLPLLCAVAIYSIGTALFEESHVYWSIIAIGFFIVWVLYYPAQHKKMIASQTKKMLSEGDNTSLFGKKTLTVKDTLMTVTGENEQEQFKIESIKKIKQLDDLIVIYNSSVSAIIIPIRDLSLEEIDYLKSLK